MWYNKFILLKEESNLDTYAVVTKLKLQKIEGAKTLQIGFYGGLPYAVSKDITEDDLVLVFLPDSQLSKEYAEANDLVARHDPETGEKLNQGYFGKNRKVRPIKLMGGKIRSVGFVATLDTLEFTGYDTSLLHEGDSFNELNGVPICNKYVNKRTRAQRGQKQFVFRREEKGLAMHPDTAQFYKFAKDLEAGDFITITLKLDGTSVRVAKAYEPISIRWWQRPLEKILPIREHEYKTLVGTRRVIIERTSGSGFYGDHSIYEEVGEMLEGKLYPGESIYGEIVGWVDEERPLFNRGGVIFKYGTLPGERDFYVYNIKWTLPNGESIDLPWYKIKSRCQELGLKHVPEMTLEWNYTIHNLPEPGRTLTLRDTMHYKPNFIYDGDLETLETIVYSFVNGPDPIDKSHIREGVVLRVDKADGSTKFFKAKSEAFYSLEDKAKSDESFVDAEEIQDEV